MAVLTAIKNRERGVNYVIIKSHQVDNIQTLIRCIAWESLSFKVATIVAEIYSEYDLVKRLMLP